VRDLHEILVAIGDPPCVDCRLRQVCRSEQVACADFSTWTNTGRARPEDPDRPRRPTRDVWARLYSEETR
jgi:hypothetical protein